MELRSKQLAILLVVAVVITVVFTIVMVDIENHILKGDYLYLAAHYPHGILGGNCSWFENLFNTFVFVGVLCWTFVIGHYYNKFRKWYYSKFS